MKFYVLESEGASFEPKILTEQRFASTLGIIDKGEIPAVVLDRGFHQRLTGMLFRKNLGLPPGGSYSIQEIWEAYQRVYGRKLGRWDWLKAIRHYFER
jgi:aminoglycoside phosphotransferase (APT) family kinase protein